MGLGSEIRKKPIPDPGVKKATDPGSATRQKLCKLLNIFVFVVFSLLTFCSRFLKASIKCSHSMGVGQIFLETS
jgi:hypothetical protein